MSVTMTQPTADEAWRESWSVLCAALDRAREITRLFVRSQRTTVVAELVSFAELDAFRMTSGVDDEHPDVQAGIAALRERYPGIDFTPAPSDTLDAGLVDSGVRLHRLLAGLLSRRAAEFDRRPQDAPDSDERIRREFLWCWDQLVLGGLNGRASVGRSDFGPNRDVYPGEDTSRARKEWALRRTSPRKQHSIGERLAAQELMRAFRDATEPMPRAGRETDSLAVLDGVLPPALAAATRRRLAARTGHATLSAYQQDTIPLLTSALEQGENLLFSAVTGSGKSLLGQLAAGYVVGRRELGYRDRRAVIALPLKALVGDVIDELEAWFADAGLPYRVLGGSRDYPEHVEDLAAGRYEVAVMIYETLDRYLSSGQDPLRGCGVLVVDELQYIDDESRGPRLESMMAKVRTGYPDLPIVGISAVMSDASRETVARWLDVGPEGHRHTAVRPVPLNVRAYDGRHWRMLRDTTSMEGSERGPSVALDEESDEGDLNLRSWLNGMDNRDEDAARIVVDSGRRGGNPLASAVVLHELRNRPDARILVYTRSRTSAFSLSRAVQAALDLEWGAVRRTRQNPWRYGRFRDASMTPEEADRRHTALNRTATHVARKDVETGLKTGCAYHTRQLTRPLRELIQDEFRSGLLRVLVTTDTLSVGLNLPIDVVVIASVTVSTGDSTGELRSLNLGEVKNRLGRAGRLGLSSSGEAWILTEDPEYLSRKLQPGNPVDVPSLSTTDGIWDHYVLPRHGGTEVQSRMTDDDLALLLLQTMTASRRADAGATRDDVLGATLRAFTAPANMPDTAVLVDRLRRRGLLADVPNRGPQPTPAGVAIGVNNLPLQTAPDLERIAGLAAAGAHDLDLLVVAAGTTPVQRLAWTSMSAFEPDWTHGDLERATIASVRQLLEPLLRTGEAARTQADAELLKELRIRDQHAELRPLPAVVLADRPVPRGSEVGRLLADHADLEDANVVLRALIGYFWRLGVPFTELRGRIEAATLYHRDRPRGRKRSRPVTRRVEIHLSDVEQLCDQLSNVLGAADHIARHQARLEDRTQRIRPVAEAVWAGVPSWTIPMLDLHVPALHRERLLPVAVDDPPEELIELLDDERLELSEAEIRTARTTLERKARRARWQDARLPNKLSEVPVTSDPEAPTYGDYFNDLTQSVELGEIQECLSDLGDRFGLTTSTGPSSVVFAAPDGRAAEIVLRPAKIRSTDVDDLLVGPVDHDARAVLPLAGTTDRAREVAQSGLVSGRTLLSGADSLLILLDRAHRAAADSGGDVAVAVLDLLTDECGHVSVVQTSV